VRPRFVVSRQAGRTPFCKPVRVGHNVHRSRETPGLKKGPTVGIDDIVDKAKEIAGDVAENTKEFAGDVADNAKEFAGDVKEFTGDAVDKAKDFAGDVKDHFDGDDEPEAPAASTESATPPPA